MEYGEDTNDDKSHSSGGVRQGKSVTWTSLGAYSEEPLLPLCYVCLSH